MIFIVEQPPDAPPRAWFAHDADDLARKLETSSAAELFLQGRCRVLVDEAQAMAALEEAGHPDWQGPSGWRARLALRQQLIATEVLADDL